METETLSGGIADNADDDRKEADRNQEQTARPSRDASDPGILGCKQTLVEILSDQGDRKSVV